tara:strand:- start:133 stop:660 length:528 start_codon:yes stop_codon:yes gene_type:complete
MAKKVGLKIGVVLALVVGGYFAWRRWGSDVLDNGVEVNSNNIIDGTQVLEEEETGIFLYDISGVEIGHYEWTGNDMAYPLRMDDGCMDENPLTSCVGNDNVAILQSFLIFESGGELDMKIDGKFGQKTTNAVIDQLTDLINEGLGYDADTYDWEEVTSQYYTQIVLPTYNSWIVG